MSSIDRVGAQSPVQKLVNQPIQKEVPTDPPKQLRATDKVELSGMQHLLSALKKNDVRVDRVAEVKAQIEAGAYEDDKKLDVAIDRLLEELEK